MREASQPYPSNSTARAPKRVAQPRRLKWYHHLFAFCIFNAIRLLSCTWRCRFIDERGTFQERRGPMIFALWHNRLALSSTMWERFARRHVDAPGLVALISASHDGGLLARTLRYFNIEAVRGSSSRRGPQALLELNSWAERGYAIAITPDGPRGPRYQIRDGVIALGQLSGLPVLPISAHVRGKVSLRSWDQFQIPLPFARCEISIGQPLLVPREATDEQRAALREELQRRLMALTRD